MKETQSVEFDENSDLLTFNIDEVARQVGVVPATLRNWERQRLFTSRRSTNGYRIFDLNDIEFLKQVCLYSKEENMGINAIRILMREQSEKLLIERENTRNVSKSLLSRKWKESREERGYQLNDVAKAVGISPSYLSKIENSQANPSFDVLCRIAAVYGENLLYYIDDAIADENCVKSGLGRDIEIGTPGLSIQSLVSLRNFKISSLLYTIEPGGCSTMPLSKHNGQEFLYVLEGEIIFSLNDEKFHLFPGDSLSYRSQDSHIWSNNSSGAAKLLWVYTPGSVPSAEK